MIKLKDGITQKDIINRFKDIFGITLEEFHELVECGESIKNLNLKNYYESEKMRTEINSDCQDRSMVSSSYSGHTYTGTITIRAGYTRKYEILAQFTFKINSDNVSGSEIEYLEKTCVDSEFYITSKHGESWTEKDVQELLDIKPEDTIYTKAWDLGRSVGAIRSRLYHEGVLDNQRHNPRHIGIKGLIEGYKKKRTCAYLEKVRSTSSQIDPEKEKALHYAKAYGASSKTLNEIMQGGGFKENPLFGRINVDNLKNNSIMNPNPCSEIFLNNKEENNMTNRRNVIIELFDNSKGIEDEDALVFETEVVTSESDVNKILQGVLLEEANTISESLEVHNEMRMEKIDLDILQRTGNEVYLQPIKFKDLTVTTR